MNTCGAGGEKGPEKKRNVRETRTRTSIPLRFGAGSLPESWSVEFAFSRGFPPVFHLGRSQSHQADVGAQPVGGQQLHVPLQIVDRAERRRNIPDADRAVV